MDFTPILNHNSIKVGDVLRYSVSGENGFVYCEEFEVIDLMTKYCTLNSLSSEDPRPWIFPVGMLYNFEKKID